MTRDPLFFQAYCQLAFTEINIYSLLDHTPEHLALAEAALQTAARLRPDAGETHLARARNLYWGYLDYDGALRELEIARQSLPGEDWIFSLKGYIERRRGRWEECIRDLERATELDPRNFLTLQQLAITYEQLRRYAKEKSTLERILAFQPNDPVTRSLHAFVELDSKADTRPLHEVIDSIREKNPAALPSIADNWLLCAFAERDPAAARKALIALGENPASLGPIVDVRFNRPFMEGVIASMARDDAKVRSAFIAARAEQEKTVQAQPNYAPALCMLGLIDAGLGNKEGSAARRPTSSGALSDRKRCGAGNRDGQVFGDDCGLGWRERSRVRTIGDRHSQPGRSQLWPIETDAVLGPAPWRSSV